MVMSTLPALVSTALLGLALPTPVERASHRVVYEEPKRPDQAHIAAKMKEEHILEDAVEMISILRFPKLLTVRSRPAESRTPGTTAAPTS